MRIRLSTFGCSANVAESEMIAGMVSDQHELTNDVGSADVSIINSCTVKGDSTILKEIRKIKEKNPHSRIVLSGCVSNTLRAYVQEHYPDSSIITTQNIRKINEAIGTKGLVDLRADGKTKLALPRKREKPGIGIIPISNGCMDHCTYCSTKLSKGALVSYPVEQIVAEMKEAIEDGCKQIWITSQDVTAYGQDLGLTLIDLLRAMLEVPGDYILRIGMGNPTYCLDYVDELIQVMQDPRIYKFLHIPIQSGNDVVLQNMKRRYTMSDCKNMFEKLRAGVNGLTIATDIIVAFPGETDAQFEETLEMVPLFDVINISRFVPRKGTLAAKMAERIDGKVSKERSQKLSQVFRSQRKSHLAKRVGRSESIIIESNKNGTSLGRTVNYTPVVIEGVFSIGSRHNVVIESSTIFHLKGKILRTKLNILS